MQIINKNKDGKDIPVTVFLNGKDGKIFYSVGLYRKNNDKIEYGYIPAQFNKDSVLSNKDKIIIKNASLDFYIKDTKTILYIRVWEFEKVKQEEKSEDYSVVETSEELPF